MHIVTAIHSLPQLTSPCGLTIGTFDGVHIGHQALIQALRSRITPQGTLTVLTFSNHPSDVFSHRLPTPLLTTLEHKLKLLELEGVDLAIVIPFTAEFAAQPFAEFLTTLKQQLNFTHLTLGTGASFGKNRQGDETHIRALSKSLHFTPEYLPKVLIDGLPVSSGRIRTHLSRGELEAIEPLVGRPYSIYAPIIQNKSITFAVPGLCLPPEGSYKVLLKLEGQRLLGTALIDRNSPPSIQIELTEDLEVQHASQQYAEIIFLN